MPAPRTSCQESSRRARQRSRAYPHAAALDPRKRPAEDLNAARPGRVCIQATLALAADHHYLSAADGILEAEDRAFAKRPTNSL